MRGLKLGLGIITPKGEAAPISKQFLDLLKNDTKSAFFGEYSKTDRRFTQASGGNANVANGQQVAMDLDSSKWDGRSFSDVMSAMPELGLNGGFSTSATWALTQASIAGGQLTVNTPTGSYAAAEQPISTVAGKWYVAAINIVSVVSGMPALSVNASIQQVGPTSGAFRCIGPASAASSAFAIKRNSAVQTQFVADDASYKELPGVAASQAISASRPALQTAGLGYLVFDGTDDFLTTTAMIPGQSGTIVAAFRANVSGLENDVLSGGSSAGDKRARIGLNTAGLPLFVLGNLVNATPLAVNLSGQDVVLVMTWGNGRRRCYVSTQPDPLVLDEAKVTAHDGTGTSFTLGAVEGGGSNFLNGRVYGWAIRNVETPDSDVRKIIIPYLKSLIP